MKIYGLQKFKGRCFLRSNIFIIKLLRGYYIYIYFCNVRAILQKCI